MHAKVIAHEQMEARRQLVRWIAERLVERAKDAGLPLPPKRIIDAAARLKAQQFAALVRAERDDGAAP